MFGPWTSCLRQRKLNSWVKPGGGHKHNPQCRDPARKIWQDMMKEANSAETHRAPVGRPMKVEPVDSNPLVVIYESLDGDASQQQ